MITVHIKLFALGRELIGTGELDWNCPEGTTVETLLKQLKNEYPRFAELTSFLTAVNMEYVEPNTALKDGDEVAIIPPVSGG
ncbi:MAG: molybdopterin converting factor subunit 1 [Calditrichaeota bacterium]|nr:MAG: molybdopterin converting factor subunit 1 [Calditrichota bacterium]